MSLAPSLPPRATYTDQPIFRLSVDQYHELIRSGKLTSDDPVELLEGILVFKMPKKTAHATTVRMIRRVIGPNLPPGWFFDAEQPITLTDVEPEPDGVIVRGAIEDYAAAHPGPADVALVIDVADTSLEREQSIKLRSYARAGIGVYWLINLIDRQVHVYTDPDPAAPAYRQRKTYPHSESIPLAVNGKALATIAVATLLPPPPPAHEPTNQIAP
jgi:Uma2 family endonuclease